MTSRMVLKYYMVHTKRVQILKYQYDLSNGPQIWCNQLWLLSMFLRLRQSTIYI